MMTELDTVEWGNPDEPDIPDHHISFDDFEGAKIDVAFKRLIKAFNKQSDMMMDMGTAIEYISIELRALQNEKETKLEKIYI